VKKIAKENYWELAVFLMDYHSGEWSRGYRLLGQLEAKNFSSALCDELRESEVYQYLVANYSGTV
jgi:hypothetical protein